MDTFQIVRLILLSTVAFVVTIAWTPLLTKWLYTLKIGKTIRSAKKAPVFAKLHKEKEGTPTMGGLLVWVTVLVLALGLSLLAHLSPESPFAPYDFLSRSETWLPLGALVLASLVGLVDDWMNVKKIGPNGGGIALWHRMILFTLIACAGAWWFYVKLDWDIFHVPFIGEFSIGWWYVPVFIFIIVATSFSVNETDGLDGLAGGTLMTSFLAYGAIAFLQGRYDLAALCAVIAGALMAFLWFNIYPARFFMGDTGSMGLGVALGVIAMLTNMALLLPIIGAVLVLESLSVLIQRASKLLRNGKKIWKSTPIHHHFEAIGWPEPKIVMRAWVISSVCAGLGVALALIDLSLI